MHPASPSALEDWARLPDEQIVRRVLAGQTALFEVLMRRHNERMYRAARAIVRDESEAEDILQQAYVNAYGHLRQFDGRSQFSTWLARIVVHEALARARRRNRYTNIELEHPATIQATSMATAQSPERLAFARELGGLIESAVDKLPDGAREVFMLRTVEGMSTEEVAVALDVSEAVVKTRLSRARAALRRELTTQADAVASSTFRFLRPRCDRVVGAVLGRVL
jgi:RNA polymerase sigma-70 factor (ECF subfamily)